MPTLPLYLLTVFIWGTSWFFIKLQLGEVAPQVSILYRFAIAAAILLGYCLVRGRNLRYRPADHARFATIGLFLFNLNFLFLYFASAELTSGLVSVLFSSVQIFNMVIGYLVLGDRVNARMIIGALAGIGGIALVFLPELENIEFSGDVLNGVAYALLGTLFASFGMVSSSRFQRRNIPVLQTNAFGMSWSVVWMTGYVLVADIPFGFDLSAAYVGSLAWLTLLSTILGFSLFMTLIGRVGAARASYAMVMFPLVALAISTAFEAYQWSFAAVAGVSLAITGNILIMGQRRPD